MKTDRSTKVILMIIAALLFLNLVSTLMPVRTATAQHEGQINRYQISAWAAHTGGYGHHAGYYVLDTVTGKVVDQKEQVHEAVPPK